jgi:uncharacterized protein (TIGR00730 family)
MDKTDKNLGQKAGPAICVFCGSSFGTDPAFAEAARIIGAGIAQMGARFVFGGGVPGLMGEAARAAREAGTQVVGILPGFLRDVEPPPNQGETTEIVSDLFVRKQKMIALSDAFVVLPGGLGTFDEFFEVLTAAQLHVESKPIVVVNVNGYFEPLDALVRNAIKMGFARDTALSLYDMADGPEAALATLKRSLMI